MHVQTNNDSSRNIHSLLISKVLSRIGFSDLLEVKKLDREKVLAELNTKEAANHLVDHQLLG